MHIGWLLALLSIVVRLCVSNEGYSGFGKPPMHGDYEAQRHWMEITVNLPLSDWYTNTTDNDLQYWGLDYPPLTAYHSYALGTLWQRVHPPLVELHESRGLETPQSKGLMRLSVLLSDMLIFFPAVALYLASSSLVISTKVLVAAMVLLHPAILLIDHGHFQYNAVCLGFALLAIGCINRKQPYRACVFFVLSLCFKQIALYYALPLFFVLLAWAMRENSACSKLTRIAGLGVVTVVTFTIMFLPWLRSGDSFVQVMHRLFPFARGIFEDKVANFWCMTNLVVKWKLVFSASRLQQFAIALTLITSLPSCFLLFRFHRRRNLLYSLSIVALSFFLFSFQVHEKSILFPLLPIMLLVPQHPTLAASFGLIATFSMFPLLQKDDLVFAYTITQIGYGVACSLFLPSHGRSTFIGLCISVCLLHAISFSLHDLLPDHITARYPDLKWYVVHMFSAVIFAGTWLTLSWKQFRYNYPVQKQKVM